MSGFKMGDFKLKGFKLKDFKMAEFKLTGFKRKGFTRSSTKQWMAGFMSLVLAAGMLSGCGNSSDNASAGVSVADASVKVEFSESVNGAADNVISLDGRSDITTNYSMQTSPWPDEYKEEDRQNQGAYFRDYGINPFKDTSEKPLSTFSLDVDTASYTIARKYIESGSLPPKEAIRPEEFVNYFRRDYPIPAKDTFSIYTELAPSAFNRGCHILEVGVQGKDVAASDIKPSALTFVIDVSGSMGIDNRLGLVKKSLKILVEQMGENDKIGIVVYGTNGRKLLEPTSGEDEGQILSAIDRLEPEGSTNAAEGLILGYDMAYRNYSKNSNNRIILCTDGVANQGITGAEDILKMVEDYKSKGITLTTLGFGMDNFNDIFLETLADKGDGNYAYIDTLEEAKKVFVDQLAGTLEVIAKDTKAQIEFDKGSVESYRLIGYENRALQDKDFRNNTVDAGEVGAGHAVTALYELKLKNSLEGRIGVVKLRYKSPDTGKVTELSKTIDAAQVKDSFYNATPRFRFISMVAQFAEILKGSPWASNTGLEDVYSILEHHMKDLNWSKEDKGFMSLVRSAAELKSR